MTGVFAFCGGWAGTTVVMYYTGVHHNLDAAIASGVGGVMAVIGYAFCSHVINKEEM